MHTCMCACTLTHDVQNWKRSGTTKHEAARPFKWNNLMYFSADRQGASDTFQDQALRWKRRRKWRFVAIVYRNVRNIFSNTVHLWIAGLILSTHCYYWNTKHEKWRNFGVHAYILLFLEDLISHPIAVLNVCVFHHNAQNRHLWKWGTCTFASQHRPS